MGVDTATLNRLMRGLLTHVGVMPEGVRVVSKDQWELGNQMGVLKEDYLDTIEWMSEELEEDLGHDGATIPIEKKGAKVMYCINPREVKYDPRTIKEAALIFWAAGEDWTMPEDGWDNTNFGLFSGDDGLGGASAKREYDKARELGVEKIIISECGHGYRSTRFEGVNWAGEETPVVMESSVETMLRYVKEGKIKVDPTKNPQRMTFHDSCNNARSGGFFEEPRELLRLVSMDFQEMYPNRAENYCCTGGGGAMSMSEYTPKRLQSAKIKADQIRATGAKIVVTSCHNCVDGLNDLIKHYELGCEVKQLVDLVANALVLDDAEKKPEDDEAGRHRGREGRGEGTSGRPQDPGRRRRRGCSDLPDHGLRGRRRRGDLGFERRRGHRDGARTPTGSDQPRSFDAGQGWGRDLCRTAEDRGDSGDPGLCGHRPPRVPTGDLRPAGVAA